jgi:Tol biopolymer transport system component
MSPEQAREESLTPHFIAFSSRREGNRYDIWRVDSSYGALKRLTQSGVNPWPHCSAGGKWVVYNGLHNNSLKIEKVFIDGGHPSPRE